MLIAVNMGPQQATEWAHTLQSTSKFAHLAYGIHFCLVLNQCLYNLEPSSGRGVSQWRHFHRHFSTSKIKLAYLRTMSVQFISIMTAVLYVLHVSVNNQLTG